MEHSSPNRHHKVWVHYSDNDAVSFTTYRHGKLVYLHVKRHHKGRSGHHVISNNIYALNEGDVNPLIDALLKAKQEK